MKETILNKSLPIAPWLDPATWRLPGMQPIDPQDWLIVSDTFSRQMRLRETLITRATNRVHALSDTGRPAAEECLDLVLAELSGRRDFSVRGDLVTRPDREVVEVDRTAPLLTIGRLVQEDICILEQGDAEEHVLTGAILCFPSGWMLDEKIGRPLFRIHAPVPHYDENVGRRVQRLFDAIRPERPMWRANALLHHDPYLFAPRREADARPLRETPGRYLRSERQTLRKLPGSGAVVFTIHTFVVPVEWLYDEQAESLYRVSPKPGA